MIVFDQFTVTELCEIMERNKSDKGSTNIKDCHHNYTTLYHSLFTNIKDNELNIFD